jgi:peptidoglycan hydrolase-like protein with peptidoglycan-binding domain
MKSSLHRSTAVSSIIFTQLTRWSTISLLAASSLNAFVAVSEAQDTSRQEPTFSETPSVTNPGNLISRATLKLGSQGRDVSELQATLKLLGFYGGVVDGVYSESTAIAVSRFQSAAGLPTDGIVGPATWNQLFPPSPPNIVSSTISSTTRPTAPPAPNSTTSSRSPAPNSAATFPVPQIASGSNRPTALNVTPSTSSASNNNLGRSDTSASSSDAAPSSVELPVLRLGMQGSAVSRLQERLQKAGFFQGVVDGAFGPETQTAVKAAQRQYQLEVDGIVGPATWSTLLR